MGLQPDFEEELRSIRVGVDVLSFSWIRISGSMHSNGASDLLSTHVYTQAEAHQLEKQCGSIRRSGRSYDGVLSDWLSTCWTAQGYLKALRKARNALVIRTTVHCAKQDVRFKHANLGLPACIP